jgi:DNA-binding response OmpR family regulator
MPTIVILAVGSDQLLLGTQRLILQSAGYCVVSALSVIEAINRFLSGDFDLVILGHSIPTKDRDRLTSVIRESGSLIPIVLIAGPHHQGDSFADTTIESDPKTLLVEIKEILGKTAKNRW